MESFSLLEISLIALAYLLGSISSAIILSRIMGFPDPRTEGSNNPGATNVNRIAGKKAAALTLFGDMLKGVLPVLLAHFLQLDLWLVALVGFGAFMGHCYPLFFGFKGGKGVATAIGFVLAFNWLWGLITVAIWLLFAKVFKISSLAAIIAFAVLPVIAWQQGAATSITGLFLLMSLILIWRHRSNIQRLLVGEEK